MSYIYDTMIENLRSGVSPDLRTTRDVHSLIHMFINLSYCGAEVTLQYLLQGR